MNQTIDQLQAALNNEQQKNADLQAMLNAKDKEINYLNSELNRVLIQGTSNNVDNVLHEHKEMELNQQHLAQYQDENNQLKQKITKLQNRLSKSKHNEDVQQQLIERLQKQNVILINKSDGVIEQQQIDIKKLQKEKQMLQQKCAKLSQLKADNHRLMKERKESINKYNQQIPRLSSDVVQWKNRAMYLEKQIGPYEQECMQQLKKLDKLLFKFDRRFPNIKTRKKKLTNFNTPRTMRITKLQPRQIRTVRKTL